MRRTALAALALLALATPARAAAPQVTDPAGDANFTGTGVVTDPASVATLDIRSVRWWADDTTQRVSLALADSDPSAPARYVLRLATPSCDAVTIEWRTGADSSWLTGCSDMRWYAPPRWSGDTLTFSIPRTPRCRRGSRRGRRCTASARPPRRSGTSWWVRCTRPPTTRRAGPAT